MPVYYAHFNHILLLRKNDTPGHFLTRHSPTTALRSAMGSVSFYSTIPLSPTADMKRISEISYADQFKAMTFQASVRNVTDSSLGQPSLTQLVYMFCLLAFIRNVEAGSGIHPASESMVFSPGIRRPRREDHAI